MTEYARYILAWTPGWPELLVILIIALIIFGRKLPDVARSLGKSLTEFKKGIHEGEEVKDDLEKEVTQIKDDITRETKDTADKTEPEKSN